MTVVSAAVENDGAAPVQEREMLQDVDNAATAVRDVSISDTASHHRKELRKHDGEGQGSGGDNRANSDNEDDEDDDSIGADLLLVDKLFPSVRIPAGRSNTNTSDRRYQRRLAITLDATAPDDISYHPSRHLRFFAPPTQRQKWGDTQILPRVQIGK